jgi:hypothetical protein
MTFRVGRGVHARGRGSIVRSLPQEPAAPLDRLTPGERAMTRAALASIVAKGKAGSNHTWEDQEAKELDRRVFNRSDALDVANAEREARTRAMEREAVALARVDKPRKPVSRETLHAVLKRNTR